MLTGIDHVVVVVSDLEAAIKDYERWGFTVVRGGRHPTGTHNALISFEDGAYVEVIAFLQPNPEFWWWTKLQQGGGLVDFCMQTDDLPADVAAFRQAGNTMSDPSPFGRVRPDGYSLKWLLSSHRDRYSGVVPFLIQDETPREERVPPAPRHRNEVTGIGTLSFAVDELTTLRSWYARITGNEGQETGRADLDAAGVRFTIGPHRFEFLAPRGSGTALAEWLRARGPSPYSATLITAGGKEIPLPVIPAGKPP